MQRNTTLKITARMRDGDALMLAQVTFLPASLCIDDMGDAHGVFLRSVPPRRHTA